MDIKQVKVGTIIEERTTGIEWEVEKVYPHYVSARRLWNGQEHFCEQIKCFDRGQLVIMGYENGGDPRTAEEKEGIYGKPRC